MTKNEDENSINPFLLIEQGNALEASNNQWGSSYYYSKAYTVLLQLYNDYYLKQRHQNNNNDSKELSIHSNGTGSNAGSNDNEQDRIKVAALYHDQSVAYLHRARKSFISALMFEREEDLRRWGDLEPMVDIVVNSSSNSNSNSNHEEEEWRCKLETFDPIMTKLTKEEMERRVDTFRRIFVTPIHNDDDLINHDDTQLMTLGDDVSDDDHVSGSIILNNDEDVISSIETTKIHSTTTNNNNDEKKSLEERLQHLVVPINDDDDSGGGDKQNLNENQMELSLEERLANLNSSLQHRKQQPCATKKTEDKRLEHLRFNLENKFGLTLPDHGRDQNYNIIDEQQSLSDDEQIQLIMNMAKDELALLHNQSNEEHETIEDLLQRSGVRIQLPSEYDTNNDEFYFSRIEDLKNNIHGSNLLVEDDDNVKCTINDKDDMKMVLNKTQEMLLQVSFCIDEINAFKSSPNSRTRNEVYHNLCANVDNNDADDVTNGNKKASDKQEETKTNITSSEEMQLESNDKSDEVVSHANKAEANINLNRHQDTSKIEVVHEIAKARLTTAKLYLEHLINALD